MSETSKAARVAAAQLPVARVVPLLGLTHLDREFDYQVPESLAAQARPGCRVRIRFAGRLVDAFLVERVARSEHTGDLAWLERVISPEPVLPPESWRLVQAVARRWMGTRSDVLRLAVPPRHASAENSVPPSSQAPPPERLPGPLPPVVPEVPMLGSFLAAALGGVPARGAWSVPPGADWAEHLASLAGAVHRAGRQVLLLVPDQRDVDHLVERCRAREGRDAVVEVSASVGPSARYRRWLLASRGHAGIVVGTRSAVFTPMPRLGLIVLHDDGDDSFVEPRAPYPHTRDVAVLRSHLDGTPLLLTGIDRTPEVQALVESGWAPEVRNPVELVRAGAPRVVARTDLDPRQARDVAGGRTRLPAVAVELARAALDADTPVLVVVPRTGYVPTLLCGSCRTPVRCRRCHGPVRAGRMDPVRGPEDLHCGWCGALETRPRCPVCGSTSLRAGVVGAGRTAEEIGRLFPGVRLRTSSGAEPLASIEPGAGLVVSTPGVEPRVAGGYGCALILDAWSMLARDDLRAPQDAVRRWLGAASLVRPAAAGGAVYLSAEAELAVVQAVVRWAPQWWAGRELAERREVGFPPAVHMVALDGPADELAALPDALRLPGGVDVLGPVELPEPAPSARRPDPAAEPPPERLLLRVPPPALGEVAAEVHAELVRRASRRDRVLPRVRLDPPDLG